MNKILFSFIFILFSTFFIQAQNIKVEYLVKTKQSKSRPAKTEPFLLLIKPNNKSLFISKNTLISDSIFKIYYKKITAGNPREIRLDASDPEMISSKKFKNEYEVIVEKDFAKHKLKYQQHAFMSTLQYTSDFPVFNWKLKDENKEILGYPLKKANLTYKGRNYTAWYAPKIAVSDGPLKFWGLPGLIFEIYDDKDEYHFTVTGIEFPQQLNFPKKYFSKGGTLVPLLQTTDEKFQKDFDKTFNANNVIGSAAYIGNNSEELKAERVKKIKSKYDNPIELTNE